MPALAIEGGIPVMMTSFTDVTGNVFGGEEIERHAEHFRQQTGITPYILVMPDIKSDSVITTGRMALTRVAKAQSSLLIIVTTESRQVYVTGIWPKSVIVDDKLAQLIVENQTLAYFQRGLLFQGINTALDVLQASLLEQPVPPIIYYAPSHSTVEDEIPGSKLGFFVWLIAFMLISSFFDQTKTPFGFTLKISLYMIISNLVYQSICLFISTGNFSLAKISLLWSFFVGFGTFISGWLFARKR